MTEKQITRQLQPSPDLNLRIRSLWKHGDFVFIVLILTAALVVVALVFAIGYELWQNSALARQAFGFQFITTAVWDPNLTQQFGALPYILGTLVTSLIAILLAVPIGLGAAVFLSELAPKWLRSPLGLFVEMLAAVPSVVYGLWGLFAFIPQLVRPMADWLNHTFGFSPIFKGPIYGPSRLAAGLLLTIMILPTVIAISRDVFQSYSQRAA